MTRTIVGPQKLPPYLEQMLERQGSAHRVMILNEKHDIRVFEATGNALFSSAREIVVQRHEMGYYQNLDYQQEHLLKMATRYNDGTSALYLLELRKDYEYEGFELVCPIQT